MLNLSFKTEYIIGAVVIVAFLAACFVREYGHTKQVERMQERIETLAETANIQKAQIDEMTARLKSEKAERESVESYCTNIEAIMHKSEEVNHDIVETIIENDESRDWYNSPVPDELCDILHERLCDRPCGHYKD